MLAIRRRLALPAAGTRGRPSLQLLLHPALEALITMHPGFVGRLPILVRRSTEYLGAVGAPLNYVPGPTGQHKSGAGAPHHVSHPFPLEFSARSLTRLDSNIDQVSCKLGQLAFYSPDSALSRPIILAPKVGTLTTGSVKNGSQ